MTDIAALVAESRADQDLPPKVTDAAALRRVAGLFTAGNGEGALSGPRTSRSVFTATSRAAGFRPGRDTGAPKDPDAKFPLPTTTCGKSRCLDGT